jgi:hypothetical protein
LKPGSKNDAKTTYSFTSSVGNSTPTAAFHSISYFGLSSPWSTSDWILAFDIVDGTHTVRGSRIRRASAAISSLGLDLDLREHRVLMRMRSGTWRGRQC